MGVKTGHYSMAADKDSGEGRKEKEKEKPSSCYLGRMVLSTFVDGRVTGGCKR